MNALLASLLDWVQAHPNWAWTLVFLVSALDSLFVIGMFLPGATILIGVGALIALGALDFWTCIWVSTVGSMIGDTGNFFLGRHLRQRLFRWGPLARNPQLTERGRRFFEKHGGKSVLLGRYIGLLRPLTPAIAGVYGMEPWRFLVIDTLACIGWALVYCGVGVAMGASLGLAAEVGARLATVIVAVIALVWFAFFLARRAVSAAQYQAGAWMNTLLDWSRRHRLVGRLGSALADPAQPETPGLAIVAVLLLLISAAWLTLWWGLGWRAYPPALDALVYQGLQDLQTPQATALAVGVAELGEWQVYGPVAAAVLAALVWQRRMRAATHWIAAVGLGVLISAGLYALPTFTTPLEFYRGALRAHFSGRELVLSTIVYGFLPLLLDAGGRRTRAMLYGSAVTLLLLIVLAQLYLGAQWFTMALYAVLTGALWVAALGLGFQRHRPEEAAPVPRAPMSPVLLPALLAFVAAAALHWDLGYGPRLAAAQPRWALSTVSQAAWIAGDYKKLPMQRMDMAGRAKLPFNLQWAGDLKDIEAAAAQQGWRWPVRLSGTNALHWLDNEAHVGVLPLLPLIHAGRHPALVLRRDLTPDDRQYLIQLWPSPWKLQRGPRIWVGTIGVQQARTYYRLLRYPVADTDTAVPAGDLLAPMRGFSVHRVTGEVGHPVWLLAPSQQEAVAPAPAENDRG